MLKCNHPERRRAESKLKKFEMRLRVEPLPSRS
jgi:hypothetical protein